MLTRVRGALRRFEAHWSSDVLGLICLMFLIYVGFFFAGVLQ